MDKYKVGMVSLGCDKNRVDAEIILGKMSSNYEITNNPKDADIIIVNTCGFIESAKEESINTILEMAEYKNKYRCKMLIATGCLTQRYGKELLELMPEIDITLGVNDYEKINEYILQFINNNEKVIETNYSDSNINEGIRILTTKSHTAYLRIAEGCNNYCTYCAIPKIRGKFRSRTKESVLEEARLLSKSGVKELILIAQDLTMYGVDLYGGQKLHELVRELSQIEGIEWIRLLYCYPEELYDELLEEIANNDKVLKYLDLPIQHISNNVLKRMARKTSKEAICGMLDKLRKMIPGIVLRTSIIVGFPGETKEEFEELVEFAKEYTFDNLGVFKYSQEEGTGAAMMENQIPEEVKEERFNELMIAQLQVAKEINNLKINSIYDILVEGHNGEYYYGRSTEMAPEIDGIVFVETNREIKVGTIVKVKITSSDNYDLTGVEVNESC